MPQETTAAPINTQAARAALRARQPARNAAAPGREHESVVEPIDDEVLHPGADVDRELERASNECDCQEQDGSRAPTLRTIRMDRLSVAGVTQAHPDGISRPTLLRPYL